MPSFPVFTAELRVAVFQFKSSEDSRTYNGYIRDCPQLERPFPCILRFCSGRSNPFSQIKKGLESEKKVIYTVARYVAGIWSQLHVHTTNC